MQQSYQCTSSPDSPCEELSSSASKGQRGQLVLEYILLMLVAVSIALLIQSQFIGGGPQECAAKQAPILTQLACNITDAIAMDHASEVTTP